MARLIVDAEAIIKGYEFSPNNPNFESHSVFVYFYVAVSTTAGAPVEHLTESEIAIWSLQTLEPLQTYKDYAFKPSRDDIVPVVPKSPKGENAIWAVPVPEGVYFTMVELRQGYSKGQDAKYGWDDTEVAFLVVVEANGDRGQAIIRLAVGRSGQREFGVPV